MRKVTSNNQRGGITAGVINFSNSKKNKKNYPVIAIVLLILAVLTFFGADQMFGKDKIPSEIYNVESNNQSGGITAGKIENVNIGDVGRHLDEDSANELINYIPKGKEVSISYPNGDGEAYKFALEIKKRLEQEGYTVFGLNVAYYTKMFYGQSRSVHPDNDNTIVIQIGANPD